MSDIRPYYTSVIKSIAHTAAAVCAADRLLARTHLTQQQVADAASPVVVTSRTRLSRDNCEFVAADRDQHGTEDPGVGLDDASDILR